MPTCWSSAAPSCPFPQSTASGKPVCPRDGRGRKSPTTLPGFWLAGLPWANTPTPVAEGANLAPWFGPNLQRNVYLSLLHLGSDDGDKASPRVPESVLRAALLRRAVQDIERLIQIKSAKQACSTLLLRGSVGDDLWQRFQRAEKEMEEELRDVVTEVRAQIVKSP